MQLAPTRSARREMPAGWFGALLAAPAVLVTVLLLAYPLLYSLWVSLHDVPVGPGAWRFVGIDNYRAVATDPLFGPTIRRTLAFSGSVTVLVTVVGLAFAQALSRDFVGRNLLRGLLILPWSVSQAMLALTFGWIFNSTFGPLNGLLLQTGVIDEYVSWFASGQVALTVIAVALVWHLVPFATLLFLGAVQTIPEDLLNAARVDGAGAVRRFLLVTLPWIKATALIVVVLAALNAFLSFAPVFVLTGGGPGTDTTLLSWWGYVRGFRELDLGESAAIYYLMTLIIVAIAALTVWALGRERHA